MIPLICPEGPREDASQYMLRSVLAEVGFSTRDNACLEMLKLEDPRCISTLAAALRTPLPDRYFLWNWSKYGWERSTKKAVVRQTRCWAEDAAIVRLNAGRIEWLTIPYEFMVTLCELQAKS